MDETTTKNTRNTLTGPARFRLNQWLMSQTDAVLDGQSRRQVAALAAEALGHRVTQCNIEQASADTGVTWRSPAERSAELSLEQAHTVIIGGICTALVDVARALARQGVAISLPPAVRAVADVEALRRAPEAQGLLPLEKNTPAA